MNESPVALIFGAELPRITSPALSMIKTVFSTALAEAGKPWRVSELRA